MISTPVAVCSRTFSKHPQLRAEMEKRFSNVKFNDDGLKLVGESLADFLKERVGAIVALEPVGGDVLRQTPKTQVIAKYGVGLDNIQQEELAELGVYLGWTGGVNRRSVSELALGLTLSLIRKISEHNILVKAGEWQNLHGQQLSGKTVGIIGCGFIGQDFAKLLRPFNCRVLINDIVDCSDFCTEILAEQVSKEKIYAESDVVSLHVPLTPDTENLIDSTVFKLMKNSSILINTSRGRVVDERALFISLKNNEISGAALDVFAEEPPDSPLFELPNFIGTPHNGGSSAEGVLNMGMSAIDNLERGLREKGLVE